MTPFIGSVRAVHGQIVEVGYHDAQSLPKFYEVLTSVENPSPLEVYAYSDHNTLYCLSDQRRYLFRNMQITSSWWALGRAGGAEYSAGVQSFGEPVDNKGQLKTLKCCRFTVMSSQPTLLRVGSAGDRHQAD